MVLSEFGEMFTQAAAQRGLTKRDLAAIAGCSSGKLTETLRDRGWAKEHGKRWYGPDLSKLDTWARVFQLSPQERARFVLLAELAHAPPGIAKHMKSLEKKLAQLETIIERYEQRERGA